MNKGFISVYRKITEWEWYDDANTFRLYMHLLLKANWETKKWHGKIIERGSLITSREKLARELKLGVHQIRTGLDKLRNTENLTIKTTNKYTLITIENYNDYQEHKNKNGQQGGQQVANKWPQLNNYNNYNNYIYSKSKKFANYTESKNPNQDEINRMEKLAKKYGVKNDRCEM